MKTGFSITITLQPIQHSELVSFWPYTRWLFPPHLTYSPHLAPYDFFVFPKLKKPLKGRRFKTILEDLRLFWRIRQMRRRSWKPLQEKCTRTVSRSGNTLAISECIGEESTLKGTQTCNSQIKYIFMTQSAYLLHRPRNKKFTLIYYTLHIYIISFIKLHCSLLNKVLKVIQNKTCVFICHIYDQTTWPYNKHMALFYWNSYFIYGIENFLNKKLMCCYLYWILMWNITILKNSNEFPKKNFLDAN